MARLARWGRWSSPNRAARQRVWSRADGLVRCHLPHHRWSGRPRPAGGADPRRTRVRATSPCWRAAPRARRCDEALDGLRAAGAEVVVLSADISRRDDVARRWPSPRGDAAVGAGSSTPPAVLDDGLSGRRSGRVRPVLGAEGRPARGTCTSSPPADRLDFFVLYSSTASLLGAAGQANYAAANAFLDGLGPSSPRRSASRACSVNWGAWSTVGMAARSAGAASGASAAAVCGPTTPRGRRRAAARAADVVSGSGRRGPGSAGRGSPRSRATALRRPFLELMAAEVTSAPGHRHDAALRGRARPRPRRPSAPLWCATTCGPPSLRCSGSPRTASLTTWTSPSSGWTR